MIRSPFATLFYAAFITLSPPSFLAGDSLEQPKGSAEGLLCRYGEGVDYEPLTERLRSLLAMGKKGRVLLWNEGSNGMRYTISWRPSNDPYPSQLKGTIPYKSNIKAKEHLFVTYRLSGGRLGDNLLAYARAKWMAMKYGVPLIVHPFKFFDRFALSACDFPRKVRDGVKRSLEYISEEQLRSGKKNSIIVIPYFAENPLNGITLPNQPKKLADMCEKKAGGYVRFSVDWEDPTFKKEISHCLSPLENVATLPLPRDKISIAIHIRRGGDYEDNYELHRNYPLKAPLDEYYIGQLRLISSLFKDKPLYVYLFTDDLHPEELARKYKEAIGRSEVTFDWNREKESTIDELLLRDFFSIGKFDCLIRSESNFSLMAAKRGFYTIESHPLVAKQCDDLFVIDALEIRFGSS